MKVRRLFAPLFLRFGRCWSCRHRADLRLSVTGRCSDCVAAAIEEAHRIETWKVNFPHKEPTE